MRRSSESEEPTAVAAGNGSDALTAESIASRRFEIVKKGFATEEVTAFLAMLSDHVRTLEGRLEAVRAETDSLRKAVETAYAAEVITPLVVQEVPAAGGAIQGEAGGPEAEAASAEALRIVTAAEETAQEILASAEEAAARIRSDAQMDSEKVKGQADEYADRAARRLAIQSQEVRDKLREEVRRVRAEVADEAERLLSRAREEAGRIAAEGVTIDDGTVVSRLVADAEAETDVARQAAEILSAAREKADELVDHARRSRREIVARLNDERVRLDEHVRLLQTVQKRLQADITAARNAFAGVLGNLDGLNLHDTELPVLDAELVAMVELDLDAVGLGDAASPAVDDAARPRGTHLGEIAGDDLFDRVVAERGSADAEEATRRAGPDTGGGDAVTEMIEAGTESAEQSLPAELEETTWGDDDLSVQGEESGGPTATAGDAELVEKPDPRSRLKAAFSTLTAELETVGGEEAPGVGTAPEDAVVPAGDAPSAEALTADAMAGLREAAVTKYQPAAARKLKRAIQQAENIALHAHKTGAAIAEGELTAELVDHVSGVVRDVAAAATDDASTHAGRESPEAASDLDASAVREIIDSVAGDWWASLVQDLVATDESGVHGVVRSRRQQAGRVAVDLTREAYDAGLLRAAITWAD